MINEDEIILNLQKLDIKILMNFLTSFCNTNIFLIIIITLYFNNIINFNDLELFLLCSLVSITIKLIFKRKRPYVANTTIQNLSNSNQLKSVFSMYSFPSGHTMEATLLALILFKKYNNNLFLLFPIIIGFTRVYLGVHYPSDVLFGILISFIIFKFILF